MPRKDERTHSILIVSASEQFIVVVKRSLEGFRTIDIRKSAAQARRCILERPYELIVINAPLPDENGVGFALDAAEREGTLVIFTAPEELYLNMQETAADLGILMLPKPLPKGRMDKAIRFLIAVQNKMEGLRRKARFAEEKLEENRIVSRAKLLLMERRGMTEDEAHRLIGKEAMDQGISRGSAARQLLEELE